MKRYENIQTILSRRLLLNDRALLIVYSLALFVMGILFLFKHTGLSGDSIYIIDTATNIAQGRGFVYTLASYLSLPTVQPLDIATPMYTTLASLFIRMGLDTTLSARLISLIFLVLMPVPMFYLTENLYGRTIAHAATIVLVLLWAMVYIGSYTWVETTFIFFILMSMLFLAKLMKYSNESPKNRSHIYALASGLCIGLTYLTKGNGGILLLVAFFTIFFLMYPLKAEIKRKSGLFLLILLGFAVVNSIWWVRNYIVFDSPFYHGLISYIKLLPARPLEFLYKIGTPLFPLVVLLPYALKYLFVSTERKRFLFLTSFPAIMALFFITYTLEFRLLSPTYPFLIIISVKAFFDIGRWWHERSVFWKRLSLNAMMTCLLVLAVLPQLVFTASYYVFHTPNFLDKDSSLAQPWALEKMASYEAIDWIKANTTEVDVLLSNDYDGLYHYTRRDIVWAGGGANYRLEHLQPYGQMGYSELVEAIDRLHIDYVVLFRKPIVIGFRDQITRDYDGDFVYDLSQASHIPPNLSIVYDKEDAIIYKVNTGVQY